MDLAAKLQPQFWQVASDADTTSSKRLVEGGMELIEVPPAMLKEMREKTVGLEKAFTDRAGPVIASRSSPSTRRTRDAPDRAHPELGCVLDTVDELSMGAPGGRVLHRVDPRPDRGRGAARNLINYSIYFAWEFSAYLMGAAFLLGAAYALRAGAQIRRQRAAGERARPVSRFFDLCATATAC